MKKTIAALALLLAACGTTSACGSNGDGSVDPTPAAPAAGYNDPDTLARGIEHEALSQRGVTLTVDCIPTATAYEFVCHAFAPEDGSENTVTVHVSPDGQDFLTEGSGARA